MGLIAIKWTCWMQCWKNKKKHHRSTNTKISWTEKFKHINKFHCHMYLPKLTALDQTVFLTVPCMSLFQKVRLTNVIFETCMSEKQFFMNIISFFYLLFLLLNLCTSTYTRNLTQYSETVLSSISYMTIHCWVLVDLTRQVTPAAVTEGGKLHTLSSLREGDN